MSELTLLKTEATPALPTVQVTVDSNPFRVVVDPEMRQRLRAGLLQLIDHHDQRLADFVASGQLALDSYKEYIELFARGLRETMETPQGVAWLLESAGFTVAEENINLDPEWRWKEVPLAPDPSDPSDFIPQK